MAQFLRETIAEIDEGIAEMQSRRNQLAVRLAAIDAATDPAVLEAAADYEARTAEKRPYEGAEDANSLITEAHRHYYKP
jgi:hypothetical protein